MPMRLDKVSPIKLPLLYQYQTFTHGGIHWPDNYNLELWAEHRQPVVYKDQVVHGYPLIRRVGKWSWLTKNSRTRYEHILSSS